ncbi:MAG: phosphatidate cytidylyltransferase [Thermodesulfovibrionales bacterium]
MHLRRLIVAAILVPLLYLYVTRLPVQYFFYLITVVAALGLYEFYTMFRLNAVMKYLGIAWGISLMTAFFLSLADMYSLSLVAALFFLGLRLFLKQDPGSSMQETATVLLGLIYVPGLLTFQLSLGQRSPEWIILLYTSVWAADSAAYYIGKNIGRHKLYEAISPNKTVEGAAGSLLGGAAGAILIRAVMVRQLSITECAILGVAVGATTIIGDLVESMLKRDAGVKDSGSIFPGHGGILDKIDGSTFAGPVFFWVCLALGVVQK